MASAVDERKPILAGDLSEFSVQSLMSAFSLGRQVVTIEVLDARGACDGRIVMKAGRVLSAHAGGRTGVEAVQHLLASAVPARFRVVRESSDLFARAPHLGTLAEVTAAPNGPRRFPALVAGAGAAAGAAAAARARTRVMEGSLSDFDVATILQVVSTARQHTVMEVLTHQGTCVGSIQLKAGKVLSAEAGSLRGVLAVRQLLAAPSSFRFTVHRAHGPVGALPLLGAVDQVLMHAASEEPARPWARSGIHLAPSPPTEPDPDEVETLIPPPSILPADAVAEIEDAVDDAWDELEDEVTRVSSPRAPEHAPPASRAGAAAPDEVPVLDGRLSDFDLSSVLQVAGMSRQPTCVRIFDDQRRQVGEVRVQGGQLLMAAAQGQHDQAALRFLLHSPRDFSFAVVRQPSQANLTLTPLGSVSDLLQWATSHDPTAAEDAAPLYRTQAPSLPAAAPSRQTWKLTLGVGLVLGIAAGAIVTAGWSRDSAAMKPTTIEAQAPAPRAPAQRPAAAPEQPAQELTARQAPLSGARAPEAPAPGAASPAPEVRPIPTASPVPMAMRSRVEIASLQGALKLLNCHPGPIDGVIGPLTRTAIATFQFTEGLQPDGELTPATEERLYARIRAADKPRVRRRRVAPASEP